MSTDTLAQVLDECVEDLLAGRATVEECLARHPELEEELAPLLRIAAGIAPLTVAPDPARRLAARARFIEALYAEPERQGLLPRLRALLQAGGPARQGLKGSVSLALALALVGGGSAVYASEQALPGAPLYGVKLAVEQVRLAAARDEEGLAEVQLEIAGRRLNEIERALGTGDPAAARAAAEAYARTLDLAAPNLAHVAERDGDRVQRLQSNLQRQQDLLARVASQASPAARDSIEEARGRAARGLTVALAASSRGRGGPAPALTPAGGAPTEPTAGILSTPAAAAQSPDQAGPGRRPEGLDREQRGQARPPDREDTRGQGRPERDADTDRRGQAQPEPRARTPSPEQPRRPDPTPDPTQITQVEQLARDVQSRLVGAGESERSLRAKLQAAEAAIERGQPTAARTQLQAFLNELDALRRQGAVSAGAHAALAERASAVLQSLDRNDGDRDRQPEPANRDRHDRGPDATLRPSDRPGQRADPPAPSSGGRPADERRGPDRTDDDRQGADRTDDDQRGGDPSRFDIAPRAPTPPSAAPPGRPSGRGPGGLDGGPNDRRR